MSKQKSLGQIFTPKWVVDTILDNLGYTADNPKIVYETVLEPSFGEGIFFVEIVDRFVRQAREQRMSSATISELLNSNIHGIEYDRVLWEQTKETLNQLLVTYSLPAIGWDNIVNGDTLQHKTEVTYKYIVGNPPYIRIHNMDTLMRETIKRFPLTLGAADLYIIFYEICLNWLATNGKLGFITPNSYMKNASQQKFRDHLLEHKMVTKIINFGTNPIFGKAATYTAITILDKSNTTETIHYQHEDNIKNFVTTTSYSSLKNKPWVFLNDEDHNFFTQNRTEKTLKNVCLAQNGVSTLRDNIFVNHPSDVEKGLLKPVAKASKFDGTNMGTIIFPYKQVDGKYVCISEDELKHHYPNGYKYLLDNKPELLTRSSDRNTLWFQYGRSQSLNSTHLRKLVVPPVISSKQENIKTFIVPENTIVYSKFFVTEIDGGITLEDVQKIVEHPNFCRYVKLFGKDMGGNFKSFNTKVIHNYHI